MGPRRSADNDRTLELGNKLASRTFQLEFLTKISEHDRLKSSTILSSIRPTIGKSFHYADLEKKKNQILMDAKIRLIEHCAKIEAARDVKTIETKLTRKLNNTTFGDTHFV